MLLPSGGEEPRIMRHIVDWCALGTRPSRLVWGKTQGELVPAVVFCELSWHLSVNDIYVSDG